MNISESHLDVLIIYTIFLRSNDSFVGKNRFPSSLFLLLSVYHFCFLDCYCYYGRRADNTPRRLYSSSRSFSGSKGQKCDIVFSWNRQKHQSRSAECNSQFKEQRLYSCQFLRPDGRSADHCPKLMSR